jgi:arylsulfatase A-like enzyme
MKQQLTSKSLAFLTLSAGISACNQPKTEKPTLPNIIFIMSDDHAYQAIGAYGDTISKLAPTPNIDQIAAEGMRFDRCLVTNSISGPSRACILTGKYSHKNGFLQNEATPFDGSQQTFPKLLQKAGYSTCIIGKWHLDSDPTGFSYWEIVPGQGDYYNPEFKDGKSNQTDTGYVTEIITQKSLKWMEEQKKTGNPFLLMVHHKAPHRNWQPGPRELGMYKDVNFPEPATLFDDYSNRGLAENEQDMTIDKTMLLVEDLKMWTDSTWKTTSSLGRMDNKQKEKWDSYYNPIIEKNKNSKLTGKDLVKWKYQRYMHDYLECVAAVDKSVGEILKYLKDNGLDKNTIVVYTSDQGFYLGEHGWFDKRFMFEQSYRTPLLIKWNGVIKPGSINNDMVSNIDFAETFLSAAGIEIPKDMQGENMIDILKGNTPKNWRKSHYYHYYEYPGYHSVKRHYGISSEQYKLIHYYYNIDQWELYDFKSDPLEMINLYDNPKYASIKNELHKQLKELMLKYGDSDSLAKSFLPENKK